MTGLPAIFFLLAVSLAFVVVRIAKSSGGRKRRDAFVKALHGLHFDIVVKPDNQRKVAAFAPFDHLKDRLRYGWNGVRWSATGAIDGVPVHAIGHSYHTGAGDRHLTYYRNTAAAVDAPPGWPMLHLSEERHLYKLGGLMGGANSKGLELGNEAFNKRWRIKYDDEGFARLVLAIDVQEWLVKAPKGEWWAIGRGWVVCGRSTSVKPDEVGAFLKRPGELLRMLPAELDVWEAAATQARSGPLASRSSAPSSCSIRSA